jgi:5-methyltetrahydrofolate--homocysteine methyltransferase
MDRNAFKKLISERILILDGAMGTELQKRGFLDGVGAPEELNLRYPERIKEVQEDYLRAGSNIIIANTFGANRHKLADYGLQDRIEELNMAGVRISREVAQKYNAFVAGDMGPIGAYLSPLGPISFDQAYELFAEQAHALQMGGADLIFIETMAEIRETKAAIIACRDHFRGPVIAQMTFTPDGNTVTGTGVLAFVAVAEACGADGIGVNCSAGPKDLLEIIKTICANTALPVSFKPNAGIPTLVNRETIFPGTCDEFVETGLKAHAFGVNMIGGCCGTTPEFIRNLSGALKGVAPVKRVAKDKLLLASRGKAFDAHNFGKLITIGERINPTNRKKFQEELGAGNFASVRREAKDQVNSGALVLDLNLGLPNADEPALLSRAVEEVQEAVSAPLCIDSSSPSAIEAGLKACAGKPILNSVSGEAEKLKVIIPLAKRYGAALVGLAVDERGLPKTAAERLLIAGGIIEAAVAAGIPECEIIIDYLTLAVSAMPGQVGHTLEAIRQSKKRWPKVKTILGVSNISFGMPSRQLLNSTFLRMAVDAGLDFAILNPHEDWKVFDDKAAAVLIDKDANGAQYIASYGGAPKKMVATAGVQQLNPEQTLRQAVVEGNREEIAGIVRNLISAGHKPLAIANDILLSALNEVGKKFNEKEYFLPQVILAAEAAQTAFGVIKPLLAAGGGFCAGKVILATVKGDVHDIGKNIVAAVLESHGFEVIDLGKNISAGDIVKQAIGKNVPVVGLSALMTTTMLEMEEVVKERARQGGKFKIMLGGAPVTEKFTREINADGYARDAVEAASLVKRLIAG